MSREPTWLNLVYLQPFTTQEVKICDYICKAGLATWYPKYDLYNAICCTATKLTILHIFLILSQRKAILEYIFNLVE